MSTGEQLKVKKGIYSKYPDLTAGEIQLLFDAHKKNSFGFVLASDCFDLDLKDLTDNEPTLRGIFIEPDIDMALLVGHGFGKDSLLPVFGIFDKAEPGRVISAWSMGAESDVIASARVIDGFLYVISGAFRFYRIAIRLIDGVSEETAAFLKVQEFGHYVWFPNDIHLTMDDVRCLVDAKYKEEQLLKRVKYLQKYGDAIKTFREKMGISKVTIEARTGLSARQQQRYENEGHEINLKAIEKLAEVHGMPVSDYLEEIAKIASRDKHREDERNKSENKVSSKKR